MILLNVNICSVQERLVLKPAWFSRSFRSISFLSLISKTLQKLSLAMVNNVIPLQLSQSYSDPFFRSSRVHPLVHSFGTSSEKLMTFPRSVSFSMNTSPPCLKNPTGKLSIPDALLFFNVLIASVSSSHWISSRIMLGLLPLMSFSLVKSKSEAEFAWLSASLKCSTHLWFCSSSDESTLNVRTTLNNILELFRNAGC